MYLDEIGNPIRTVDSYEINNDLEYNDEHQLISERKNIRDYELETTYTYNNFELNSVTNSEGDILTYNYDNYHRLTNTTLLGIYEVYVYLNDGNIGNIQVTSSDLSLHANIAYTYEYDNIKTITTSSGSVYEFIYTVKQQISAIYLDEEMVVSYSYNNLDLLTTKFYGTDSYYAFSYHSDNIISISFGSSTASIIGDFSRAANVTIDTIFASRYISSLIIIGTEFICDVISYIISFLLGKVF